MKICLINNLYKPYARGGAETVVETVAGELEKNGHEVFIIATRPYWGRKKAEENPPASLRSATPFNKGANSPQPPLVKGVTTIYLPSLYYNLAQIPLFLRFFWHIFDVFNKRSYFAIRKILKKEKPDIVMTHNLKGLGYLIPRAIKKSGIKWIHTIHDVQLVEPSGVIMSRSSNPPALRATSFIKEVYMRICRWLFDSPDRVVSPSKWLMDFYSEKGFFAKSRKVVMPNPVDIATRNLATRGIATGNLATRDMEDINFLYLGQIEEHKGVLFLIEVFKKFLNQKSEIKNLKLLIAGPGSKLEEIKKLAADEPRIKILGRVPHEQIAELLGQADFTIVPSLCYENSPTVITESFSFGVPVITARIGGAAELVREGVNGFIFEAGSEEDLLRALRLAVEKRNDFKKEEIRKTVEEFGVRKYVEKLLNL